VAAALLVAAGGAAVVLTRGGEPEPEPEPQATGDRQPATGNRQAPEPERIVAPVAVVDAGVSMVAIRLESDPSGATIELEDGTELGPTPFDWLVAPSETPIKITFKKDGYEPRTREVTPRVATSLLVDLPRAVVKPPVARPRPSPKPEPEREAPARPEPEPEKSPEPPKPPPEDDLMKPGY
jgi:hypothetical protein